MLYAFCLLISFKIMRQVRTHGFREWYRLRDKVLMMTGLTIIVWPTVNNRQFAWPVTMNMFNRSSPLQGVRFPWILRSFLTVTHGIEEVPNECELRNTCNNRRPSHQFVYRNPFLHERELRKGIISSRNTVNSHKVHREEHQISSYKGYPEMEIAKLLIHHPSEHLRIPVIHTRKHTENRSGPHHQVEVSYHKVGIMQVNVQRCVTHVQAR